MSLRDVVSRWWPGSQADRARQANIAAFGAAVQRAGERGDRPALEALDAQREAQDLSADDVAVELELAAAFLDLLDLDATVAADGLAAIQTTHRVVGGDTCYFIAPAFSADRPDEPGKVFLTNRRLVFAGGRLVTLGWGSVSAIREAERDLVIVSNGGQTVHQFRFNSYVDAKRSAYISRRLKEYPS